MTVVLLSGAGRHLSGAEVIQRLQYIRFSQQFLVPVLMPMKQNTEVTLDGSIVLECLASLLGVSYCCLISAVSWAVTPAFVFGEKI